MTELRAGARIRCADGEAGGHVDAFVVDPVAVRVTHVVAAVDHLGSRVVVAIEHVRHASPDLVELDLDRGALVAEPGFDEPDFKTPDEGWHNQDLPLDPGSYFLEPFASPLTGWTLTTHERVPTGEVLCRRGAEVVAADRRHVGRVDEFLVDPADGHITHVVVRDGHLRHRDVVLPIAHVTDLAADVVTLDLTTAEVEALPHVPVRRHGHVVAD